jgi:hypothetical protein
VSKNTGLTVAMKLAENTEHSPTSNTQAVQVEQPASTQVVVEKDASVGFFVIGGVINIVMILTYFIWAFRQWKKIDKRNKRQ